jgi:hypothetical protein
VGGVANKENKECKERNERKKRKKIMHAVGANPCVLI